jgi:hypothetical protein
MQDPGFLLLFFLARASSFNITIQAHIQIRTTVQTYSTKKMALDRVRSAQYSVILEYVPRIEPRTTSGKRDRDQALRLRAISARICPSRRDYLPRRWGTASFE